jgi:hypothetical protein
MLRGSNARSAVDIHGTLADRVQRHARVFYIVIVCRGKSLRSGALHCVFAVGSGVITTTTIVVYGRGSLRSVRQD